MAADLSGDSFRRIYMKKIGLMFLMLVIGVICGVRISAGCRPSRTGEA